MWKRWIPWRWAVSRIARWGGFVDPIALLARLQQFAQPSEVMIPMELFRAGLVFHARGLLNARAFQHNLDWVWPFWVERQFDPADAAFVPRAFSLTHINLTHRNWTAVGMPDCDWLPIVDPHGLVTPLYDGWSIDAWVLPDDGQPLLPSRARHVEQRLVLKQGVAVETHAAWAGCELHEITDLVTQDGKPTCRIRWNASSEHAGFLAVSIRPANPEGVSLVHAIRLGPDRATFQVDESAEVRLTRQPARVCMSEYHQGDVFGQLGRGTERDAVTCQVGLATAAALYPIPENSAVEVSALVPMPATHRHPLFSITQLAPHCEPGPGPNWEALAGTCTLQVPDEKYQFLFDAAVRSLVLHSPGDVYPGPFTYKRFWFRDAAFILDALLALGLLDRVRRCIDTFPSRQDVRGYFRSQQGEWDSNGAALWIIDRYRQLSGKPLDGPLSRSVVRGADWICRKRLSDSLGVPHAGLMPAGFSAEHLGLNDFYFWDDFWSAAGLRAAASIVGDQGNPLPARRWGRTADDLLAAVDRAIAGTEAGKEGRGAPASPYRRMDAGAIGNMAASYPLHLWGPRDSRLLATVDFLMRECWVRGGFFQDMIHSGINAYLTLHVAQVLLRAGDERHADLTQTVANLASPTGQWPEAIHPQTLGGCMGDGQHIWAAAEWVLMMRNLFVREEGDRLILGSGLPRHWLEAGHDLHFGPTPTPFGSITVQVTPGPDGPHLRWDADWRGRVPEIEVALPGVRRPMEREGSSDNTSR